MRVRLLLLAFLLLLPACGGGGGPAPLQGPTGGGIGSGGPVAPDPDAPPPGVVSPPVTALCRDGVVSYSAHCSGTCSHHGGVLTWYRADCGP